jgi:hypothetical protein
MLDLVKRLAGLLKAAGLWWGLAISAVLFVGSLVLVTVVVVSWSTDHFKRDGRPFWEDRHPLVRASGYFLKNLAGLVLVALGIIMALPGVPGQGLLTALIGLTLINFPGKRDVERRLIARPAILKAVNRLRARFHKPALNLD